MQDNEALNYIKQAFELKSQQCYKQAIEMLYKALEIESDNSEILFQIGELYYLLKNFPRSTQYMEKVLKKNQSHIEALNILKKIYIYSNSYNDAYEIAQQIFKLNPNSKNLIDLIRILSSKKDIDKIKEFETSELLNDKAVYEIAKAYYDNCKLADAERKLQEALKINPDNEDALVLLGKIYFDKNEFEKSKEIFNKFPQTSENPEVLNYLGLFAIEDFKFIDAIKYFSKASNIDKQNPKYFYNLGNAYFYNGWFKEALNTYRQAICMEPENLGYRYSLAYLYYEIKDFEKAQKETDFILEQDKNYGLAHVLNALLKFEKKDYLGAQAELENNIKSGDEDTFTLVSLSKIYKELLLFEKAENAIQKAISKSPESLNYSCQLAQIYIAKKEYDKALKIIEEIISKNENYICAYSTGANAALAKGDYETAKKYAQSAISLNMNFAEGYYYLALVRAEEQDFDEAVECMKRAIMYDVNNADYYAAMSNIYKNKKDYKTALGYIKEAESISPAVEYKILFKELAALNRNSK